MELNERSLRNMKTIKENLKRERIKKRIPHWVKDDVPIRLEWTTDLHLRNIRRKVINTNYLDWFGTSREDMLKEIDKEIERRKKFYSLINKLMKAIEKKIEDENRRYENIYRVIKENK